MSKLPFIVRVWAICIGAALAAPLVVIVFGADWRQALAVRVFVTTLVYSSCIGLPAGLVLPALARRIGRPGAKLAIVTAVAILVLAAAGSLVGGALLMGLGLTPARPFWHEYWLTVRITGVLGLVFGMSSYFYESLASQLRDKELEDERARKLILEAKLSSLESRIHPHFLFNTLNSISSLIPADPARAERIVGQLAALLRSSLDTTRQALIPLDSEMRIVSDYLDIEKARFGDRLQFHFDVPDDAAELAVPPLAVQCLVENAVKHGIAPRTGGGEIRIVARRDGAALRVEVRDSGPGFDLASIDPGHGIENLVSRLDALFGSAAHLQVGRDDGHCVVTLVMPPVGAEAAVR